LRSWVRGLPRGAGRHIIGIVETWADVVAAPDRSGEAREWLATAFWRPAYFFLRRQGYDPDASIALSKASFDRAAPGPRLRESVLRSLESLEADAEPSTALLADHATAEADVPFFSAEPVDAFQQGWTAELLRRALGMFYAECQRDGRIDLYEALMRTYTWGMAAPADGREERRARGRFRDTLRRVVADTVAQSRDGDDELRRCAAAFPSGPGLCARCGSRFNPVAVGQVYAGFCPRCLLQAAIDPAPPLEQIGAYEIVARYGRDARGETYKARQGGQGEEALLRILDDRDDVERALAAARLRHPGAVTVYEAGVVDGCAFMASEFVDGPTVEQSAPFPRDRAVEFMKTIAGAVAAAHETGLVHGSLDASKILIDKRGTARIGDFGFVPDTPEARAADVAALGVILDRCFGTLSGERKSYATAAEFAAGLSRLSGGRLKAASAGKPATAAPGAPDVAYVERPEDRRVVRWLVLVLLIAATGVGALIVKLKWPQAKPPDPPRPPDTTETRDPKEAALAELGRVRVRIAERANLEECAAAAAAFAKQWPGEVEGPAVLARAELARLRFDAAAEAARAALRIDGLASPAWRVVGFVAMEREDLQGAKAAFERAAGPYEAWRLARHAEDEADELLAAGLLAYVTGRQETALQQTEAARQKRESPEACRWSGVVVGDPEADLRWQKRALELRPDYTPAFIERGVAFKKQGKFQESIIEFNRAEEAGGRSFAVHLHRGTALATLGRLQPAHDDLSGALELRRDAGEAWLTRAEVRRRMENWQGAADDAAEFVKLEPKMGLGYLERGRALWKLGRKDEAELDFALAVSNDPRMRADVEKIRKE